MEEVSVRDLKVKPGTKFSLQDRDPSGTLGLDKDEATARLAVNLERLEGLQHRFYADAKRSLVVVLQGIDTAGKDGTIRKVMTSFNPQGVYVKAFKAPDGQERLHDYLWRVHAACPPKGTIGIFNRSHYEDVMVTRVHKMFPERLLDRRLGHIKNFEKMLVDEGTVVVKLFLHISKAEQLRRLESRLDDASRNWKFSAVDVRERAFWDRYIEVFDSVISATSTKFAPWWVIPSNRKWARNLAVSEIMIKTLEGLDPEWPPAVGNLDEVREALREVN
jgi:PPK2 family polyphosphate:nucleotide phosphotransferase